MEYKNPYIRVQWEDVPENFTIERIKRVKSYFKEKYKTNYVTVLPKIIGTIDDIKLKNVSITENINDFQYQKNLAKEFLKKNNVTVNWDLLDRLDNKVNNELTKTNLNRIKYNRWVIKKIEFSQFLSFGNDNVIDFEKLNGITAIESNPKNFGGKTIMTTDLFLFLFFNTTTKNKVISEIFNLYIDDQHEVYVKGYIQIDNEDYTIVRKITRRLMKAGEYTYKSSLEFNKVVDGVDIKLTDEQRRETEKLVSSAIGQEEDFLHTILTTGNNLENLIEAKPTPRGQILMRFLGLDMIKEKEEICKVFYNDWSKKLISNVYNIKDLTDTNKNLEEENEIITKEIEELERDLKQKNNQTKILEKEKDDLLSSLKTDIDEELKKTNVSNLTIEIGKLENEKTKLTNDLSLIILKEPEQYYNEDDHKIVKKELKEKELEKLNSEFILKEKEKKLKELLEYDVCPICGSNLENHNHVTGLEKEIKQQKTIIEVIETDLNKIIEKENLFNVLSQQYNDYEKNKLIKLRLELDIEQKENLIKNKYKLISDFEKQRKKIEENQKIEIILLSLKSKIQTMYGEIREQEKNITSKKLKINENIGKIESNKQLITKIKSEEDYLIIFKTYLSIFGKNGLSKMILKNIIPVINKELSDILLDTTNFSVELNISEKNEVDFIMIDNETRKAKLLSTGSGFERTISSLAIRSILTRISALPKPNIIIMDEVFGKIADENIDMVGQFFFKIKNYFDNIFLITHNPLIKNWTDNVITITKEDNISRIETILTKN